MAGTAKSSKQAKKKRLAKPKTAKPSPVQSGTSDGLDETALTKGELRKFNALRKSVGDKLAEKTFAKWLKERQSAQTGIQEDKNAVMIADALMKLIDDKSIKIPRGGYHVTRGRGRVIVEQPRFT